MRTSIQELSRLVAFAIPALAAVTPGGRAAGGGRRSSSTGLTPAA